jgi:hypothetical protein
LMPMGRYPSGHTETYRRPTVEARLLLGSRTQETDQGRAEGQRPAGRKALAQTKEAQAVPRAPAAAIPSGAEETVRAGAQLRSPSRLAQSFRQRSLPSPRPASCAGPSGLPGHQDGVSDRQPKPTNVAPFVPKLCSQSTGKARANILAGKATFYVGSSQRLPPTNSNVTQKRQAFDPNDALQTMGCHGPVVHHVSHVFLLWQKLKAP